MSNKAVYIEGSIKRHLFAAATPLLFGLICSMSIQAVDMYFIAKLGNANVTALSFCFPVMRLLLGLSLGIGIATSTIVAQLIGAEQNEKARSVVGTLLLLALTMGITMCILGEIIFPYPFTALGAHDPQNLHLIHSFMSIWFVTLAFQLGLFVADFALRAYGYVKLSSSLFITASLLNLMIDPFLIFGIGPFPHLGIEGAAIAGCIARLVVLCVGLTYLIKKGLINFNIDFHQVPAQLKEIFSYFVPAGLTNLVPGVGIAFTTFLLAKSSTEAVAAYGIAATVQSLVLVPMFALSGGMNPFTAQNFGANHKQRITKGLHLALGFCVVWGLLVSVFLLATQHMILSHYTSNLEVREIGKVFFETVPLGYMGWGAVMMICAYFNATKRPFNSTKLSLTRAVLAYVPLALLLNYWFSYEGVFFAFTIANLGVAGAVVWFKRDEFFPRQQSTLATES